MHLIHPRPPEQLPLEFAAQRALERVWLRAVRDHTPPGPSQVRSLVRDSWERCLAADIAPAMPLAPVVLDEDHLHQTRFQEDWLEPAREAVQQHPTSFSGPGHILALFDRKARMLVSEGDPAALEGLGQINFRPGGHWAEGVVGTNGPGTALATERPVHIVGAEHFCAGWQGWHCAAVPIRHPATGEVLGVLDISGFRERAHPHTLNLALALVVAIQHALSARDLQQRYYTITHLNELNRRFPADTVVAVDRHGRVLSPSANLPAEFRDHRGVIELRSVIPSLLDRPGAGTDSCELPLFSSASGGKRAVWYPVIDAGRVVGGCIVLSGGSRAATRTLANGGRPGRDGTTRYSFVDLIGESPALLQARDQAGAAARTDLPVLLLGESGTGKELFAQAIHQAGDRRDRPFVAVNCAALPRELIESELFGYTAGAFTGARREGGQGKFGAADGGTIFLDEVAELPPSAQAALLRVLAEGEITRVGSPRAQVIDVRVIAATNRPPEASLADGSLRSDLFHRLNVLPIELPPLRARLGDVPLLARRFFQSAAHDLGRPEVAVDPEVIQILNAYRWPGNVRELRNLTHRLVANSNGSIGVGDLPLPMRTAVVSSVGSTASSPSRGDTQDVELMRAVSTTRTMAEAAAMLGITRSTLYRRMERFGLKPRRVFDRR